MKRMNFYDYKYGSPYKKEVDCWRDETNSFATITMKRDSKSLEPRFIFVNQRFGTSVPVSRTEHGRVKGGATGAITPGRLLQGVPRDAIYLFQIKYSFEKFRDSEAVQEYNSIIYSYVALSIKSPQQQLISLQVWLFASFSNRYWIAYRHFRFCSMQIYFISLLNFS